MVFPFVVNPVVALIIVIMVFCTVIEILGMLGAAAIKFSAIPAVSLIMAIGISVEFAAHLTLAFHIELHGSRNERVRITLHRMLVPVLQGGLSTFFSIVLLGFSEFDFVRSYFFFVFLMVCLIGLFNGLVFLPVILSIIGPNLRECCPTICEKNALPPDNAYGWNNDDGRPTEEQKSEAEGESSAVKGKVPLGQVGDIEMADYPESLLKRAETPLLVVGTSVWTPLGMGRIESAPRQDDGMVEVALDWHLTGGQHAILYTLPHRLCASDTISDPMAVAVGEGCEEAPPQDAHLPPPSKKEKRRSRRKQAKKRASAASQSN